MKLLYFFSLILVIVHGNLGLIASVNTDLIHEVCNRTSYENVDMDYSFCVEALGEVPEGYTTDLTRLCIGAMKLTISNATRTMKFVKKIMKSHDLDRDVKMCLRDCLELYSSAISYLRDTIQAVKKKSYLDANVWTSGAMTDYATCDDGFVDLECESPIKKQNEILTKLASISLSILANLT